jgi:hypothetical protein
MKRKSDGIIVTEAESSQQNTQEGEPMHDRTSDSRGSTV